MPLFNDAAKAILIPASVFGAKLWWRWYSFKRDVAKYRQRAVELNSHEARQIARGHLLELAQGAAKGRGVYRFITRDLAKQVIHQAVADVSEATRRRESREGPVYFSPGSESKEVEEWTGRMYVASLTLDNEDFGMYGLAGKSRQERGRERIPRSRQ